MLFRNTKQQFIAQSKISVEAKVLKALLISTISLMLRNCNIQHSSKQLYNNIKIY